MRNDNEQDSSQKGMVAAPGTVVISEFMYHPVGEKHSGPIYEFIELYNTLGYAIDLSGWQLGGTVRMTLPRVSLSPKGYLVVAKDRERLLMLPGYHLAPSTVVGNYSGKLDNDGGTIELLAPDGQTIDRVVYSDRFPWPIGADGQGASGKWLRQANPNDGRVSQRKQHGGGHSLERVDLSSAGTIENWSLSPLNAATPGRPRRILVDHSPVVQSFSRRPLSRPAGPITERDDVALSVEFAKGNVPDSPAIEYFVEDINRRDEPTFLSPLLRQGGGQYLALIPRQISNVVVRFRIKDRRNNILSPREFDPLPWHAYFVEDSAGTSDNPYHLFIGTKDWTDLWEWIQPGRSMTSPPSLWRQPIAWARGLWRRIYYRAPRCLRNDDWNRRVPAIFAYRGEVYDVLARYQGSSENRMLGLRFLRPFRGPGAATAPFPFMALSWSLSFPRHRPFEGRRRVVLNKMLQSCPAMLSARLVSRMMTQSGVPAPRVVRFATLHVNGAAYHYVADQEAVDERFIRRTWLGSGGGSLFENVGFYGREDGIYSFGDQRLITDHCGFGKQERYDATYPRRSSMDGLDRNGLRTLIERFDGARNVWKASGQAAVMRSFLEQNFDIEQLLAYRAVASFVLINDDQYHNWHFYQRRSDKKWLVIPHDFDHAFGEWGDFRSDCYHRVDSPFTIGRSDTPGIAYEWNHLWDALYRVYAVEFRERLRSLAKRGGALHPEAIASHLAEIMRDPAYSEIEARRAPTEPACRNEAAAHAKRIDHWVLGRWTALNSYLEAQ